jgi:hypothetical protein
MKVDACDDALEDSIMTRASSPFTHRRRTTSSDEEQCGGQGIQYQGPNVGLHHDPRSSGKPTDISGEDKTRPLDVRVILRQNFTPENHPRVSLHFA